MRSNPGRSIRFRAFIALLLAVLVLQLWVHATRTTATWDEPVHILSGYHSWRCGDFTDNPEHPPLLKLLATVPLLPLRLPEPGWGCGTRVASKIEVAYAGAQ